MRYFVEVAGREREVVITPAAGGGVSITVDGKPVTVDAVGFGQRELSVRVDGTVLDLTIEGTPPTLGVVGAGHRSYFKVESERLRAASRANVAGGGAKERDVRSPMPGRVVKILVNVGDEVAAGQPVVVVEAMKMENEVRARKGGVVARVHGTPGEAVEANAVLISFAV